MKLTEINVRPVEHVSESVKAYCSIVFDDAFAVHDLRIIEGPRGHFVAMPNYKLTAYCPTCRVKNHLKAHYCNNCGRQLERTTAVKTHSDIAHPINVSCRALIEQAVLDKFRGTLSE